MTSSVTVQSSSMIASTGPSPVLAELEAQGQPLVSALLSLEKGSNREIEHVELDREASVAISGEQVKLLSQLGAYIGAIDQGTSSTRFVIYTSAGVEVTCHQIEHKWIYPDQGWVEQDPMELWEKCKLCIAGALENADLNLYDLQAVGITNQRESTLVWNRHTGKPYCNLIIWNDGRTRTICEDLKKQGGIDRFRAKTGLPITPYFSASKVVWILANVPGVREAAERGEAIFGTVDTWLIYKLTNGKKHITDVTNASRTMMMNIETCEWDDEILNLLGIPRRMLPEIRSSSEVYGIGAGPLDGVRLSGMLGDQQSALFGQCCFQVGQTKSTYGTGAFLLMNTGSQIVASQRGLLTTVAFKLGKDEPTCYALEGSVAYCGSVIQWLRDALGLLKDANESEALACSVPDNGGLYFVPAFAGLYGPYWRDDARGVICGMTAFNTKCHIIRAALESAAFQVQEVLEAMQLDSGIALQLLKVDGGVTANNLLMQFQADLLNVAVLSSQTRQMTALGAAFVAGLAVGFWKSCDELRCVWSVGQKWDPYMSIKHRRQLKKGWKKAVVRSLAWVEGKAEGKRTERRKKDEGLPPKIELRRKRSRTSKREDSAVEDGSYVVYKPRKEPQSEGKVNKIGFNIQIVACAAAIAVGFLLGRRRWFGDRR